MQPKIFSRTLLFGIVGLALFLSGCDMMSGPQGPGGNGGPPPPPTGDATGFLFVQNAGSGSLAPVPGQTNVFTLTLEDASAVVNYFSDRPSRIAGTLPAQDLVDILNNISGNPPNAAAVLLNPGDAGQDVAIFELSKPKYTPVINVFSYEVRFLSPSQASGLHHWRERADMSMPKVFEKITLFIDAIPCPLVLGAPHCPNP